MMSDAIELQIFPLTAKPLGFDLTLRHVSVQTTEHGRTIIIIIIIYNLTRIQHIKCTQTHTTWIYGGFAPKPPLGAMPPNPPFSRFAPGFF